MFDNTYGNCTPEQLALYTDRWEHASRSHVPGDTEPWITELVLSLGHAIGATHVLETGGFNGSTSRRLTTFAWTHGSMLTVCEIDPVRAGQLQVTLQDLCRNFVVICDDALTVIRGLPDQSLDLAWVDDDHALDHVAAETEALLPKMRPGGLILYHDVVGVCDLQQVVRRYGGFVLDTPRLGPAGGLGIIQMPK